jgi:hypothetical protein
MRRTRRALDSWLNEGDGWKAAREMLGMRR